MSSRREYLEQRAKELFLAYTHTTRDATLAASVLARDAATYRSLDVADQPGCFGRYWEATSNAVCRGCQVQVYCLERLSHATLPEQAALQVSQDPDALACALQISADAVRFAQDFATLLPHSKPAARGAPSQPKPRKRASRKRAAKRRPTSAPIAAATAASNASSAPTATPPAVSSPPTPPTRSRRRRRPPMWEPWGEHTYKARWLRERETFPQLKKVQPEQTLKRTYEGQLLEVRVKQGCYEWDNRTWPTLYEIIKAVTGGRLYPKAPDATGARKPGQRLVANWSAARFFRKAVMEAAGL